MFSFNYFIKVKSSILHKKKSSKLIIDLRKFERIVKLSPHYLLSRVAERTNLSSESKKVFYFFINESLIKLN